MTSFNALILSILLLLFPGFNQYTFHLSHAKTYKVVGEHGINLTKQTRKAKMWFITSEANTYEEFAQTAILATTDLHKKFREYDLIQVILVPDKEMIATGTYYATAFYAVDKKGAKDVSGADQETKIFHRWLVRSAEKPLNKKELEMAKLWYHHQADFPSEDLLSSLSYNREKLANFIADSLKLDVAEVNLPQINLLDYKELDFIK